MLLINPASNGRVVGSLMQCLEHGKVLLKQDNYGVVLTDVDKLDLRELWRNSLHAKQDNDFV